MPIPNPPPSSRVSGRELAVLRALGRLGTVLGTTLHELLFFDQNETTRNRLLGRLVKAKLIWRVFIPSATRDENGCSRGGAPYIYGLTDDGKEALDMAQAEPHDGTFERLLSRSRQASSAPNQQALASDAFISNWCVALLDQVRRVPALVGVHVQRHYAIVDTHGKTHQTIGAVIILAFDKTVNTLDRRGWELPWLSLGTTPASWTYVRLALELDDDTALRSQFDMARRYYRLSKANAYTQVLGGPVRPVIITPPAKRARAVAAMWMEAWPNCPALLSTFERTDHPAYGPLWGTYLSIATNPTKETTLLGNLLGTVEQWPTLTSQWSPARNPTPAAPPPAARHRAAQSTESQ